MHPCNPCIASVTIAARRLDRDAQDQIASIAPDEIAFSYIAEHPREFLRTESSTVFTIVVLHCRPYNVVKAAVASRNNSFETMTAVTM